jgi:xanthine dehydrogenase small subunit
VTEARIAYGGMAGTPKRAAAAETALLGKPFSADSVEEACAALAVDFQPITDMRASASYRMKAAQNLLRRFFLENGTSRSATRVLEST